MEQPPPDKISRRAEPPSFRDYPKEESLFWVFGGGGALAANAGYVNMIMLGLLGRSVSHVTGPLAQVMLDLGATQRLAGLEPILAIIGAFAFGALVSGIMTGNQVLSHDRNYGLALIAEGLLLAVATYVGLRGSPYTAPIAACACGMQNALATTYRGVIIRTTHLTGLLTDAAVIVGHKLRHRRLYPFKLALLLVLLGGFLAGSLVGVVAYMGLGVAALGLAAAACAAYGVIYYAYRLRVASSGEG